MNENDPVEGNDDDEGTTDGLLAGGAAAAGGAAGLAKGLMGKAKGAADAAKDAAANAKDAAAGAADGAKGAVSGAKDAAAGAAGGVTGGVAGAADAAKGAAAGAADSAKGAVTGAAGGVAGAAGGVVAGGAAAGAAVAGAASGATEDAGGVQDAAAGVAGGTQDGAVIAGGTAAAAVAGGGAGIAGGAGGSGGSGGGSGGGGGNDDDDDDKLIAAAAVSGDNQIVILGLLVAAFLLFGGAILAFFGFGGDGDVSEVVALEDVEDVEALAEANPQCGAVLAALAGDESLESESFENVRCTSDEEGQIALSGEVESDAVRASILATAGGVLVGGNELLVDGEEVTVPEVEEVEEVEEVAAAETPTTTEAPETTTTEAPETTTTEAPETTTTAAPVPEAFTMWDALNGSGEAVQFAVIGGALGLQDDFETLELDDGTPVMRTLFAPSDAALQELGPEAIGALSADPEGAAALVGYHFLEETLTAEDLVALDGQQVTTRTQLPLNVTVVDGEVVLNGVATVVSTDFTADNGIVHIVDMVLQPPTLNDVLDLDNIEFDPAQATITAAGQTTLGRAVEFFTANPTVNATIEGHTDSDGSDELNDGLSQARADAVRQFLIDAGLDGDRFTAVGFGENQLILVDGVEDKEASRRIEFVVN